jgi:hypothetical protein
MKVLPGQAAQLSPSFKSSREVSSRGGLVSRDLGTGVPTFADCGLGLHRADLCFDFDNPLFEAPLDLGHGRPFTEVTRVVKVLQVSPKFLQEFVGKS